MKLKDPYGFHTCCNFDNVNCGTPQKFFSFDKTRKACKPVYLRRLCPDLLDNLLAIKDHLNLFSRRDDCRSVCTPELVPTVATVAVEVEDNSDETEKSDEANHNGKNEFNMEWRGVNRNLVDPNPYFIPFLKDNQIILCNQPF